MVSGQGQGQGQGRGRGLGLGLGRGRFRVTCRLASVEISRRELILPSSASLSATDCSSAPTSTSLAAPVFSFEYLCVVSSVFSRRSSPGEVRVRGEG